MTPTIPVYSEPLTHMQLEAKPVPSNRAIRWPGGARFAFTIFDDPDGQKIEVTRLVYRFLADLGFRTTISVWPLATRRQFNSKGETCANPEYVALLKELQHLGFEIAYHNATAHSSTREETLQSLDSFERLFGHPPLSMANHYNADAMYWGPARLSGWRTILYNAFTKQKNRNKFFGHVEGHPYFWGDICRERIRYCRNFVFANMNTLDACPYMPYADRLRPFVNYWFAASEGATGKRFLNTAQDANQDKLEAEGGACIMYTHFAHGFVTDGQINPEFRRVMERIARKDGWFVPVSTLLDYVVEQRGPVKLTNLQRTRIETQWLWEKIFRRTS
jgi:hypothetical protein